MVTDLHRKLNLAEDLIKLSNKYVYGAMGYLNVLIYSAAKAQKLIHRLGRFTKFVSSALSNALLRFTLRVPLVYVSEYLAQHWDGASKSLNSLRSIRLLFQKWGIFQIEKQYFVPHIPEDKQKRWQCATYLNFDLAKACLVFEELQRIWLERGHSFQEDLPDHKGAMVKVVYDGLFPNSAGMGRKEPEATTPNYREEQAIVRASEDFRSSESLESDLANWRALGMDKTEPEVYALMVQEFDRIRARMAARSRSQAGATSHDHY